MMNGKEWCKSIVKGLFMATNGLIILVSYLILAFAVVDIKLLSNYADQHPEETLVGDILVIAVCVVLISICICGILGAVKGNIRALFSFISTLMLMMILQILLGIYVGVQRRELQHRVADWMRADFFRNATDVEEHVRTWDQLQTKYECCGLNGPEDYPAINQIVSLSCCQRAYRARTEYAQRLLYRMCMQHGTYYKRGCEDEILDVLLEDSEWLLGASVFILWVEGVSIMLAVWVSNNIRNNVLVYKATVKY